MAPYVRLSKALLDRDPVSNQSAACTGRSDRDAVRAKVYAARQCLHDGRRMIGYAAFAPRANGRDLHNVLRIVIN